MSAWLLDSSGNLAATRAEAEAGAKLMGQATFATPVVVTELTKGFDMSFQINQGATIWDEDGGVGAYSIGVWKRTIYGSSYTSKLLNNYQ